MSIRLLKHTKMSRMDLRQSRRYQFEVQKPLKMHSIQFKDRMVSLSHGVPYARGCRDTGYTRSVSRQFHLSRFSLRNKLRLGRLPGWRWGA